MPDALAGRPRYFSQVAVRTTVSVVSGALAPRPNVSAHSANMWKPLAPRQGGNNSNSSGSVPTAADSDSDGTSDSFSSSSGSFTGSSSSSTPTSFTSQSSTSSPADSFSPASESSPGPSSSYSSPSSFTPSTPSTSLSSTPSTTTSPLPSPSSSSSSTSSSVGVETTITSAIVVTLNGQVSTSYTAIPTILNNQGTGVTSSQRTAIIAGSVVGGASLVVLLVCIVLFYRRHQSKKRGFFQSSDPKPRTMLLSGEDLYDDVGYTSSVGSPTPQITRFPDSPANHGRSPSIDSGPRLMRPRAEDSGSIFHEGVWPPPGERSKLVDPILAASEINLSTIVDDIMGGSSGGVGGASRLRGGAVRGSAEVSSYSTSSWADGPPVGGIGKHNRDISTASETGLLAFPEPSYSQPPGNAPASASVSSLLPSRIQTNVDPSHSTTSIQNTLGSGAGPKNWLDRSPRKVTNDTSPSRPHTGLSQTATPPSPRVFAAGL